jgi:hypothetical protein
MEDLNSPPLTDPSRFEIHQFATAGRASTSATPSAARAPDLARHGSGCPVLGSLVPSGPDTAHPASSPDWLCSASLPSKIQTWSHMASASRARRDCAGSSTRLISERATNSARTFATVLSLSPTESRGTRATRRTGCVLSVHSGGVVHGVSLAPNFPRSRGARCRGGNGKLQLVRIVHDDLRGVLILWDVGSWLLKFANLVARQILSHPVAPPDPVDLAGEDLPG